MDTKPSWDRKAPAALALGLVAVAALTMGAAATSASAAAPPSARASLALDGPAYHAARRAGVRTATKAGATLRGSTVRLPVTAAVVGTGAAAGLRGTVVLRAGKRSVAISRMRLTVRPSRAISITGTLAGKIVTVFAGKATARGLKLDQTAGTAAFAATAVSFTKGTARTVRTRLKLRRTPIGRFGTLLLTAGAASAPGTGGTGPTGSGGDDGGGSDGPGGGTPSTPGTPPGTPAPPPGTPPIQSGPITEETPPLARPAGAVDITAATVRWRVRDSWVQYIAGGNPPGVTGTTASGGAAGDPALQQGCSSDGSVNTAQLGYQFRFPFESGWYDPATQRASLSFAGAVSFGYPSHGIDLNTSRPEVQLDGAASKLVFVFGGSGGTNLGDKRSVLTELQVDRPPAPKACASDVAPTLSANPSVSGTTHTYERIPGVIPAGTGSSVFAGFYAPGAPFGWLTVSFTTPS